MTGGDTICALSSGAGRAGVAVVRVSGPLAREVIASLAGPLPAPRHAVLRTIREPRTGEEIDRAIILLFAAPSSFTGEDVAEIHAHGGRAVVAGVLRALTDLGCRMAEPGEFARRAFENGRIDLTQAEGLADLIDAETEAQRRQAARQAGGALARLAEGWRGDLLEALALVEAAIDFSDEPDVAADAMGQARERAAALAARLASHLDDGRRGEILREGFRVVLAGPPNAGKSSLLNALARRDVAIVSAEAGTTRDVIEARLDLGGLPVIVADTAGIRAPAGEVELEGIRRTLARGREADLVVWLIDATAPVWELPRELLGEATRVLGVVSKVDLVRTGQHVASAGTPSATHSAETAQGAARWSTPTPGHTPRSDGDGGDQSDRRPDRGELSGISVFGRISDLSLPEMPLSLRPAGNVDSVAQTRASPAANERIGEAGPRIPISVVTGEGLKTLVAAIASAARDCMMPEEAPVITQARHRQALEDCTRALERFLTGDASEAELRAEDLRAAASSLGRITGRIDAEQVLGQIFSRFCIGK